MKLSLRILCFLLSFLHTHLSALAKVRGVPGVDYPNYSSIPKTSFRCPDVSISGFYADFETRCQVFHYCYEHRKESFLCQEGTIFNEAIKSCDYWYSSECDTSLTPYKVAERRNEYNDVPLVPVKVENNDIFGKMAALYEPKKFLENSPYEDKEVIVDDDFDSTDNNFESSNSESLRTQKTLLNSARGSSNTEDSISDFVKYGHDSVDDNDDVDIILYKNSIKHLPHNSINEVDLSSIGVLSEIETDKYHNEDMSDEQQTHHRTYDSEDSEAFSAQYPQLVDVINVSDLVPLESLLKKRLSDNLDAPRKKRFRRKPTYVVLQTQEMNESFAESTEYGVEQNQPIKEANIDKKDIYHSLHAELSSSDVAEADGKLKEDFVQIPDRKLRRNRKTLQTFTDGLDKLTSETTKFKESQTFTIISGGKTDAQSSTHQDSSVSDFTKIENKHEDESKMPVKRPRRNRTKTLEIGADGPDKVINETKEDIKEYQDSNSAYDNKTSTYNSLNNGTESIALNATEIEKKSDINSPAYVDESNNSRTITTESIEPTKDYIMPVNIMSPSTETYPEPVILILENDIESIKLALTQAKLIIKSKAPNSTTAPQLARNELEEIDNAIKNFTESHINYVKLENDEIDMTERPIIHENQSKEELNIIQLDPADRKLTENNLEFVPHLIHGISEVGHQADLERKLENDGIESMNSDMMLSEYDMNHDNIESMQSEAYDLAQEVNSDAVTINFENKEEVFSDHELNSGGIDDVNSDSDAEDAVRSQTAIHHNQNVDKNSGIENPEYSEQELNSGDTDDVIINFEAEGGKHPEQVIYHDYINDNNSEIEDPEYFGIEMIHDDTLAHTINYHSHGIYSEILNSGEQVDQQHHHNNYGMGSTFFGAHMFSKPTKQDYDNNFLINASSAITFPEQSITVGTFDENEHILTNDTSDSFDDYHRRVVEHEHIDNNVSKIHSNQKGINLTGERIETDIHANFSDLFEEEIKSFSDKRIEDIEFEDFGPNLADKVDVETASLEGNDNSKNAELNEVNKSSNSYRKKRLPLREGKVIHKEQQLFSELSTPSKIVTEFSNQPISSFKDTDEGFDERIENTDESFEERVENTDENFEERNESTEENFEERNERTDESFEERNESADEKFEERNESTDENVDERDQYTDTMKTTSIRTDSVEKLQNEEEKPIDSVFHSSSMPLPANIFEQGLYKQNLLQDGKFDFGNIYPVTFYKELDESHGISKNKKFPGINQAHNKKYRTLNSNFPFGATNLENVDDLSLKNREPSLLSFLGVSQTVQNFLPAELSGIKTSRTFFSPGGKMPKPINIQKLAMFGKNLLAFKRAKLTDFKVLFDSFMN